MSLTISANAKINLGLQIVGRRDDGYHLLHTLFQEIDCGDKIILQLSDKDTSLAVSGPAATGVPTDDANLCLQAATLLKQRVKVLSGVS
ncbi:MAG: 4-(cytidine 5'-diphospho)-2-C-methyl-D-erythritol kinase, partial [Candidatus Marinimicrobia bacterium]|nr:4-(cytidine 5'-diphospho)-2-C-methyl-D-erythritol kinase [Candidatus Neomarinimicrobiota bacterium]